MNRIRTASLARTGRHLGLRAVAAALALTMAGGAMAQGFPGRDHDRRGWEHSQRFDRNDHGRRFERNRWDGHRDYRPAMPHPRSEWRRGGYIPAAYRGPQYVVSDWRARHLQPPPVGYQWLQVNGDFVLGAIAGGLIAAIIAGQ